MGFVKTTSSAISVIFLLAQSVVAQSSPQEQSAPFESQLLEQLENVSLSTEQQSRIKELVATYGPRISKAEKDAAPTSAQRNTRTKAVNEAVARGKRGLEAKKMISAAGRLTAEQLAAAKIADQFRNEFDHAILALLTEEQKTSLPEVSRGSGPSSGAIIVRLSPNLPEPSDESQSLADVARELKLEALAQALIELKLTDSRRVVRGISRDQALNAKQPDGRSKLVRRLRSYWRIDVRNQVDLVNQAEQVERIIGRLNRLTEFDLVYQEFTFTEPEVYPHDDPYCGRQGYLDPAPRGIDARFAWTQCNGEGAGIGLVDLERGWHENHEDFTYKSPQIVWGDERPASERHGTAVLGEAIADDNSVGVVGIAPSTSYVFMTSYFETERYSSIAVAEAIYNVLPLMYTGDVLLLEVQEKSRLLPAEVDEVVFDATQLAVFDGIIVVAAAGNGKNDLDAYVSPSGKLTLNRNSADFRDSGAIMVGAADSGDAHDRALFSNFGSRIDCYGWGRNVTSTGYKGDLDDGGGDVNAKYTKKFNGTSSAAPIIAGAAIIVQGMSQANAGRHILPLEMRALLADPLTGTPQGTGVSGNIGVMPDLRALIHANWELKPSLPRNRRFWRRFGGRFE